jgi:hypothetical protein
VGTDSFVLSREIVDLLEKLGFEFQAPLIIVESLPSVSFKYMLCLNI